MTRPKEAKALARDAEKIRPREVTGMTGICASCRRFIDRTETVIWYPAESRLEHVQCPEK